MLKEFTPASGRLTFAPLETEKAFSFLVPDNRTSDPERRVEITLSDPTGDTTLEVGHAFARILDDEQPGSFDLSFDAGLDAPPDWGIVSVGGVRVLPDGKLNIGGNFATVHGKNHPSRPR